MYCLVMTLCMLIGKHDPACRMMQSPEFQKVRCSLLVVASSLVRNRKLERVTSLAIRKSTLAERDQAQLLIALVGKGRYWLEANDLISDPLCFGGSSFLVAWR